MYKCAEDSSETLWLQEDEGNPREMFDTQMYSLKYQGRHLTIYDASAFDEYFYPLYKIKEGKSFKKALKCVITL